MSDWVEYCNLESEGRIANGNQVPYNVRYWSIGNENYGSWEIGAKSADEWGRLVREAAKMMKHVDPCVELSAAVLPDVDWNVSLLKNCGPYLDWLSIHEYWDFLVQENCPADYDQCMAFTDRIDHSVDEVRGMLKAMKLEGKIRIAFDEWNLRSWHHPNVHNIEQGIGKESYLAPRNKNDDNSTYTMADAVFTGCFLNAMNRNCDIVGMANFAPILNTRGCIYSDKEGIVLRSTYHVFDLYVNYMGDTVVDLWADDVPEMKVTGKDGKEYTVCTLDMVASTWSDRPGLALAIVNKHREEAFDLCIHSPRQGTKAVVYRLEGEGPDSYNDKGKTEISIEKEELGICSESMKVRIGPHSVNVIQLTESRL